MIFIPTVSMYFTATVLCSTVYFSMLSKYYLFPPAEGPHSFVNMYICIRPRSTVKKRLFKKKIILKTCFWNNYLHFSIFLFMCYILVDFFGKLLIVQGRVDHTSPGLKLAWFYALDCHNLSPPSSHKMDEWRDTIK